MKVGPAWLNKDMEQRKLQNQIGRLLVFLGTIGLVLSFVGQGFLGSVANGLFAPGLILLFIGRAVSRRGQRNPVDDVVDPPSPLEELRKLRDANAAAKRAKPQPPKPAPRPMTREPEQEKINADLEKALAEYRAQEGGAEPMEPVIKPIIKPGDFQPKSSAEMIEEAKRRLSDRS